MALSAGSLKSSLENDWFVPEGGSNPPSTLVSAQRFAQAVSQWFALAQANGLPCVTALPRMAQLHAQAAAALQAGQAQSAGAQLALAVASYYAGQSFGPGVATFPAAVTVGVTDMAAVFGDLGMTNADRAQRIASACHVMAISTVVVFATPPFAATII